MTSGGFRKFGCVGYDYDQRRFSKISLCLYVTHIGAFQGISEFVSMQIVFILFYFSFLKILDN